MARKDDDFKRLITSIQPPKGSSSSYPFYTTEVDGKNYRIAKIPDVAIPDNPRDLNTHAKEVKPILFPKSAPRSKSVPRSSKATSSRGGAADSSAEEKSTRWWVGYSVENAPSWWKGLVTDDRSPEAMYAMLINSMIPYMSPEDQRYMGDYLSRLFPEHFGDYKASAEDTSRIPAPPDMDAQSKTYFSAQRGKSMADTLEKMRVASGLPEDKVGAGYRFLKSLAKDIEVFGSGENEGITRSNLARLYSSFDQKIGETQAGELQGYGEVARAIANPFFSAGKLVGIQKDEQGNYRFQSRNPRWG